MQTRVRVRWSDLDAFGHVNNAVFLTYLEEGRDRQVETLFPGSLDDFVLVHISVDYRREITQVDEEVLVESVVTGFGRSSVRTADTIRATDGTLIAEATTVLVATDRAQVRSRPLTESEIKALEAVLAA